MAATKMSNKRLVVEWSLGLSDADEIAKLFARIVSEVPHVELLQITPQRGNGCALWARLPEGDEDGAIALRLAHAVLGDCGVASRVEIVGERQEFVTQLQQLALDAPAEKAGYIWQAALRIAQDEHTITQLRARLRQSVRSTQGAATGPRSSRAVSGTVEYPVAAKKAVDA